jgi:hypothetical protein
MTLVAKGQRRQERPGPRAEVLGGEIASGSAFDVGVDVRRGDRATPVVFADVLEQFLAR